MTHFPFEVRGVDDSIPIKRYRRQNFPQILRRILEQPVMLPSNAHYVETTVFKIIKEKPHLTKKDYLTPYFIRVEQLEFQRVKGQWLLTGGIPGRVT